MTKPPVTFLPVAAGRRVTVKHGESTRKIACVSGAAAKAEGSPEILKLIETVVARQEERARTKKVKN